MNSVASAFAPLAKARSSLALDTTLAADRFVKPICELRTFVTIIERRDKLSVFYLPRRGSKFLHNHRGDAGRPHRVRLWGAKVGQVGQSRILRMSPLACDLRHIGA